MNDVEMRSLRRAALLLLVVSGLRWGWQARPRAEPPPGPDAAALLLAGSLDRVEEEGRRSRPLEPGERLDPNRASAVELDRLPGLGPATARAVVAFRDSVGGFRRPEELARVKGIGPATVERIRPHLSFEAPPPVGSADAARGPSVEPGLVSLNRADETVLQSLPGVGPALAHRIVEARQEQMFRKVDDLLRVRGIGPATLERLRPRVTVRP